MTMFAKFNGTCRACSHTIVKGERIVWERGTGARHATQAQCDAAFADAEAQRATLRAQLDAAASLVAPVIDVTAIVMFLAGARERGLKAPKARFLDGEQNEIALSLAKETGRNPGAVYVKVNGEYAGKVAADGKAFGLTAGLVALLTTIATNPAQAAKAYAALMGRCSFCALKLTDAGSVDAGYGPVCAAKYGLPHEALGTPSMQTVAA